MAMTATSRYRWELSRRGPEAALREITADVAALPLAVDPVAGRMFRPVPEDAIRTRVINLPELMPAVDPWPDLVLAS